MSFYWPHLLWLLLLPGALPVWELIRRRRTGELTSSHPKILRAELGRDNVTLVAPPALSARRRHQLWLVLGLVAAIVALARPQWGRVEEPVFDQSREILIALDLSRSMLSPDVKPSRLDRSKLLVQALLEKLKGERVGLVVFSGTAFLQSPLSADYEILREFLPALNPSFLPEGGTNYGALIDAGLDAFGTSAAADRFLIILSDGEATDDDWKARVDELKKKGVRVIGLGVGTAAGTMIPDGSGGFVKDDRGAVVMSRLEPSTLQQLASATGGTYRDASTWLDLSSLINQTVETGRKGAFQEKNTVHYVERFQWPLAFAVWCFLVSLYYEFPVKPRARDVTLRPLAAPPGRSASSIATAAVSAFALVVALAMSGTLEAAVKVGLPSTNTPAAAPGDPAALGKIVGRLSEKDRLSAPDLSEFAHETVNWGRRIKEAGQPVPDGPVRDALAAVQELEQKGEKLADWSQLRKELEALREKPPEPPKPPPSNPPSNQDKSPQKQSDQNQSGAGQDKNKAQDSPDKKSEQAQNEQKPDGSPAKSDQAQPKPPAEPNAPLAFGDMKQQPPPPPSNDTQKVGGGAEKKDAPPPGDPTLTVPLQKLDQLKNEDSPAEFFQRMQAECSEISRTKPKKDW